MINTILTYLIGIFTFIILINKLISWAIIKKSWYERYFNPTTILFGVAGVGIGLFTGGIGIVLLGSGFGLAGWVTFGIIGLVFGNLINNISEIVTNPEDYDFNFVRLILIIIISISISIFIAKIASYLLNQLF